MHATFDRSNIRNTFLYEESDIDKSCDFPSNRSEAPSQLPVMHQENDYDGLVGPHITCVNGYSKIRTPTTEIGDYSNASHTSVGSSSDSRHQEPEVYYSPLRHIDGSLYGEHGSDSTINAAVQYDNVMGFMNLRSTPRSDNIPRPESQTTFTSTSDSDMGICLVDIPSS